MADDTAKNMVKQIETALSTGAGVVSVTVDGQTVRWDRNKALKELDYWRRQASRSGGKRPRVATMRLTNAF